MTSHEWKVLGAFGLLVAALAMYDGTLALSMLGVAGAVVIVKNADKLPTFGGGS